MAAKIEEVDKLENAYLHEHLVEYPKESTFHGIIYIFQKKLSFFERFGWLVIFLSMLCYCIYQCKLNFDDYLKFDVSVTTTLQPTPDLEFPSITFCSMYFIKRYEAGNLSEIPLILAGIYGTSNKEMPIIASQGNRLCKSDRESDLIKTVRKSGGLFTLFDHPENLLAMMQQCVTDFRIDVHKCWWKEKLINCTDMMINKQSDDMYCFTFNLGNDFSADAIKFAHATGLDQNMYNEKTFRVRNAKTSKLRLLIAANQSEYCGSSTLQRGAGYFAMITEKNNAPSAMFHPPLFMSPGYMINVIMKPIYYRRNTQHLGRCANSVFLFVYPTAKKYIQTLCLLQCLVMQMLNICGCYPVHYSPFHSILMDHLADLNVSARVVRPFNYTEYTCLRDFQSTLYAKSYAQSCPLCTAPCNENTYSYSISFSRLTLNQLKQDLPTSLLENQTFENLSKNWLYVSFGYENSYVEIVEENQAILLTDVFIYIGSNIGLFIGGSFMSLFEILIGIILRSCVVEVRKRFRHCCGYKPKLPQKQQLYDVSRPIHALPPVRNLDSPTRRNKTPVRGNNDFNLHHRKNSNDVRTIRKPVNVAYYWLQ